MRHQTIPGYNWRCAHCLFTTGDMQSAMAHLDKIESMDHWLFEHPANGNLGLLPPARAMHGSDQGPPPYVDVMRPDFCPDYWKRPRV